MIGSFNGEHRFLSNFWPSPVEMCGMVFPTVEHAYVAAKTENGDVRRRVLELATPGEAKRFGRTIELRPGWDQMKLRTMRELVRRKFRGNPDLGHMLLATGDQQLVEGNRWGDTFWGVCDGVGENHLGRILMDVRRELRDGKA